jgi:hypothetical protein
LRKEVGARLTDILMIRAFFIELKVRGGLKHRIDRHSFSSTKETQVRRD